MSAEPLDKEGIEHFHLLMEDPLAEFSSWDVAELLATISALQSRLERAEAVASAAQEACDHAMDMGDWDEISWEYMQPLRHSLLCMTHDLPIALDEQDKPV